MQNCVSQYNSILYSGAAGSAAGGAGSRLGAVLNDSVFVGNTVTLSNPQSTGTCNP